MSSFQSHYEDPEKHLIGNLLTDQDDSYSFQSTTSSQSSTRDECSSKLSSSNAVGAVVGGEFGSSWPEPPPPYTPPSALFLPPPGLPGSTWGEAPVNRRNENAVDDWSSFLAKQPASYNPFDERVPTRSAPVTAPVHNESPMPFSYRDVVNRGVHSHSMTNSRHGSSSSMMKEEERSGEETRGARNSTEEMQPKRDSSWKGSGGATSSESHESFQQITRKKGGGAQQKMNGGVHSGMEGKSGGKSRPRAVHIPELLEPPPIEDNSRFTVLEKLPVRRNTSSFSDDDGSLDVERTPNAATLTKNERRATSAGNGGGGNSREGGGGGVKKRWTRRDERRGAADGLSQHIAILVAWIRVALGYVMALSRSGLSYMRELILDFSLNLYAVLRLGMERSWMGVRVKAHEWRCRGSEWWNKQNKEDEMYGLAHNIRLPETADEALERLLNARGQDAYSVLGVRADESDEVIKTYYKKQALLVHPDKNVMDGAAEAFQILSKAFEVVSIPEKRRKYDGERLMTHPLHKELTELYQALKTKMEETRNRMDCDCGLSHVRVASSLPMQAARYCRKCDSRHAAKNLDIWAESRFFGFFWVYYTCVNGIVYDISSWANCSTNELKHLRVDNHTVQYRMLTTQQNKEARQRADRYLRMLSEGLEKATSMHVSGGCSQASLQPIDREEDRPRKAKRASKKK